jgi:hypothetical protein
MTAQQSAVEQLRVEYLQAAGDIRTQRHELDKLDVPESDYCKAHSALTFATSRGVEKLLEGRAVEMGLALDAAKETRQTAREVAIALIPYLMGGGGVLAGLWAAFGGAK